MLINMRIGRVAAALNQRQLGEAVGLSASRISRIETGRFPIRPEEVGRIAEVLRISPTMLLADLRR